MPTPHRQVVLLALAGALVACNTAPPSPTVPPTYTAAPTLTPAPSATPSPIDLQTQAEAALYSGDGAVAIALYQAALTQDPADGAARIGLGRALLTTGETAAAADVFSSTATALGVTSLDLEGAAAAPPIGTVSDTETAAAAVFWLGELARRDGEWTAALARYRQYLALRPGVIDSYVQERIAESAAALNDDAAAAVAWQAAAAAPRADSAGDLREALAATLLRSGDRDGALAEYDAILASDSPGWRKARALVLAGQALATAGDVDAAHQRYLEAVATYPDAPVTFEALRALVEAGVPVDDLQRGLVNLNAGNYAPAIAAFERILAEQPGHLAAWFYLGRTYAAQDDPANALQAYRQITSVAPADVAALPGSEFWGQAHLEIGELAPFPEDVQGLTAFVAAAPEAAEAPRALDRAARFCERNDDLACAVTLWSRLAEEYPGSDLAANAANEAGVVLVRQARWAEAQTWFERATTLGADAVQHARGWLWVGKARASQADPTGAQQAWAKAAALAPDDYYGLRAGQLSAGIAPFAPPAAVVWSSDEIADRVEADAWMNEHFPVDTSTPGSVTELSESVRADGRYTRGRELWRLGLEQEAHAEFEALRQAYWNDAWAVAQLALDMNARGLYDIAIRSARQVLDLAGVVDTTQGPRLFQRLRFPVPFLDLVEQAGAEFEQHPFALYSKMRIESFFWKYAYSSADARGLNQIIPTTAEQIARDLALEDFVLEDLFKPSQSIRMGAYYLHFVATQVQPDTAVVMAGYYAGPGNAQRWLDLAGGDPDLFVEVIRLPDAKGYVTTTFGFFEMYRQLYGR
ncbi:MAG: tetratricopeptide repeat protein [Anaerolineales bacterium]|nr:tetratricopeptide repeat protein [Anaerolineales bacterium]